MERSLTIQTVLFSVRRRAPPGTSGSPCPRRRTISMTIEVPRSRPQEIKGNPSAPAGSLATTSTNPMNFHPAERVSFLPLWSFYSILFYSALFYIILFCFTLFNSILFCFTKFYVWVNVKLLLLQRDHECSEKLLFALLFDPVGSRDQIPLNLILFKRKTNFTYES